MFNLVAAFVVLVLSGCTTQVYIQVPPPLEQQIVIGGVTPKRVAPQEPEAQEPTMKKKKKEPVYAPFCRNGEWKNSAEYRYVWCRI